MVARTTLRLSLCVCVLLLGGVAATAARADISTIPADAPAPWSDPNHQTPLEQLATRVASAIAGYPAAVHCDDQATWDATGTAAASDAFARTGRYDRNTNLFIENGTLIEISPPLCLALQQFAQAAVKPSKCQPTQVVATPVTHWRTVWRWHTVKGKRVRYRVRTSYKVMVKHSVLGQPAPCFLGSLVPTSTVGCIGDGTTCWTTAAALPIDYWNNYSSYAHALKALAHEASHMKQSIAGLAVPSASVVEAQAECSGMQQIAFVAEQFGDTPDDAQAIASFYWDVRYPSLAALTDPYALAYPYWSADCKPGGALDARPAGSTLWP
jgi:hypothetical protein